jgi:hypothetical protein
VSLSKRRFVCGPEIGVFLLGDALAFFDIDLAQKKHSTHEKHNESQDAEPAPSRQLTDDGENERAQDVSKLTADAVKAKEL